MKTKDFKILAEQLMPCLPDSWSIKGQFLYACPTQHVLRGLCFEGSGFDATVFHVWVFFLPLCVPTTIVSLNFGKRLRGIMGESWFKNDPDLMPQLRKAVIQEALPFISEVETLPGMASTLASDWPSKSSHVKEAIAYALAYSGDMKGAKSQLEQLLEMLDQKIHWQREMAERAALLKTKLSNIEEAQEQLRIWEMESRTHLKLD